MTIIFNAVTTKSAFIADWENLHLLLAELFHMYTFRFLDWAVFCEEAYSGSQTDSYLFDFLSYIDFCPV